MDESLLTPKASGERLAISARYLLDHLTMFRAWGLQDVMIGNKRKFVKSSVCQGALKTGHWGALENRPKLNS